MSNTSTTKHDEGIFPHMCEEPMCQNVIMYDDEPKCFSHSPDSGASVKGYSARAEAARRGKRPMKYTIEIEMWCTPLQLSIVKESIAEAISYKMRAAMTPMHSFKQTSEEIK